MAPGFIPDHAGIELHLFFAQNAGDEHGFDLSINNFDLRENGYCESRHDFQLMSKILQRRASFPYSLLTPLESGLSEIFMADMYCKICIKGYFLQLANGPDLTRVVIFLNSNSWDSNEKNQFRNLSTKYLDFLVLIKLILEK